MLNTEYKCEKATKMLRKCYENATKINKLNKCYENATKINKFTMPAGLVMIGYVITSKEQIGQCYYSAKQSEVELSFQRETE